MAGFWRQAWVHRRWGHRTVIARRAAIPPPRFPAGPSWVENQPRRVCAWLPPRRLPSNRLLKADDVQPDAGRCRIGVLAASAGAARSFRKAGSARHAHLLCIVRNRRTDFPVQFEPNCQALRENTEGISRGFALKRYPWRSAMCCRWLVLGNARHPPTDSLRGRHA